MRVDMIASSSCCGALQYLISPCNAIPLLPSGLRHANVVSDVASNFTMIGRTDGEMI